MPQTESKNNIAELKSRIRQEIFARRFGVNEAQKSAAIRQITASFLGNAPLEHKDRIAGYWPISSEVDTKNLMEILAEEGHTCCLPVFQGDNKPLIFRHWHPTTTLHLNAHLGVYEPPKDAPVVKPKVIIVPLVAFDAMGYRLGMGKGFYDRTLEQLSKSTDIFTIGLAYSMQQVTKVPHEAHDQRLDCVITENRVFIFEKG